MSGTQRVGRIKGLATTGPGLRRMLNLGPGYVVWDKAGEIEFVRPARTAVTARFDVTDDGTVVARVRKEVHIRRTR